MANSNLALINLEEHQKQYRSTNKTREIQKKYRGSEKSKKNLKVRFESVHGRAVIAYNTSKRRAKLTNKEYELTLEWFKEKLKIGLCEVSGISFDLTKHNKGCPQFYSPSVDRIDNTKGYRLDNCRMVLDGYNRGKGTAMDKDMLVLARALLETTL